ncbi:signal transduction histidine kinase, nitrogen specific, NtrB [Desulfuromusa kysingii]|uniref:histidine kinase n=1 Tax=Desulfuromusa kysingii TaxID=37625 RepID=A0A1H3Y5E7_9BACT|nr:ATP-binding protein [Desulfuromusa kysingii]SEA06078.1 signal transduction histidine kinase, nitrogen specific, NtrB [Desulfuromusa kysingii]
MNRLSHQEYALILENIDDAIIAVDMQGMITYFNASAQLFSGLSEKQSIGQSFFECFKTQKTLCYLARTTLENGRSISSHETITLRTSNSKQHQVSVTASPIFPASAPQQGAVIVLHDLTRVRSLEGAVRNADRLAMIETMAAGLAHEIKNPLGGIKGSAQLLQMELEGNDELQEYTQLIVRETTRVNRIIEELLNLSRPRKTQLEFVNISQILNEIITLQKNTVSDRGIVFAWELDPSIPDIPGDHDLLMRLFLNLIKNSCEATQDHSKITIATRIDTEYHLRLPDTRPTPMVQVSISDQGPGISIPELEKILTPFYTTKESGNGLGLPICQKIITDHGGMLEFINRDEGGTQVKVSLPLLRNQSEDKTAKG